MAQGRIKVSHLIPADSKGPYGLTLSEALAILEEGEEAVTCPMCDTDGIPDADGFLYCDAGCVTRWTQGEETR